MSRVLITGGSGFIGTNLIEYLSKDNRYELMSLDLAKPKIESQKRFWTQIDLRRHDDVVAAIESFAPEYVIHLGARTDLNGTSLQDYDANIGGVHINWIRTRQDQSSESRTRIENREIVHYAKGISNIVESTLPLLRYFGTSRISQPKREDSGSSLKKKLNDRRCGYIGCLDDALDDKAIRAWCLKMEMEAFHRNTQIQEYENFKKLVSSIMKSMSELDYYPEVFYSRQLEDIVYSDGEQVLPISFLSAGYQSILWISMDIAYRMAIMNPHHNSYHEIPGIVMIDELDMHLHPKWQWNAIRALEENFPNIQFIIATHSPILISSCKNEHLIHIDDNHHVDYPQAAYAYSIEDVVEFVQGSTGIPYEIRDLKTSFDDALNSNDIVLAREIVQDMIAKFGCDNSEVKIALAELDVEDSLSED